MTEVNVAELESRLTEQLRKWFEETLKHYNLDTLDTCEFCSKKPFVILALCEEHFNKMTECLQNEAGKTKRRKSS